jgi:hypothetical protein
VLDEDDRMVFSSPYLEKDVIMAIGGMKTDSARAKRVHSSFL